MDTLTCAATPTESFRLAPAGLGVAVDVVLRRFGDRWLSVGDAGGGRTIGMGRSARQALRASLDTLGARTASTLMADPELLAVSQQVR